MKPTRVILTAALALSLIAGGSAMPQPARATKGTCNPAPDPYNVREMAKGPVFISVGYGWDGVSIWPECAGPLVGARVTNTGTTSWYARFPKARGGYRSIELPAGETKTYSAAQLASVGLVSLDDIEDLVLRQAP